MLRRNLISLNELNAVEEAKRLAEVQIPIIPNLSTSKTTIPADFLDLELAAALAAYNPLDPS